tara:strand:+ start:134 stop:472 length:339 start_codon:yes stop_codon:yes gene_type:complete
MCLKCHLGLSDELVSSQLQEQLDKDIPDFTKYNSTSISHFIIASSGFNGIDVRNKSITLLEQYNTWLHSNPNYILHQSLSPQYLTPMIEKIKNNNINHHAVDSLENYLTTVY